jgi:hypothetical protein
MPTIGWLTGGLGMTLRHLTPKWALVSLISLAWRTVEAAKRLGEAGGRPENWVDGVAAYRGIDLLDVLAPLTKRRSGAEEAREP